MKFIIRINLIIVGLLLTTNLSYAQSEVVLDKVIAIVGDEIITKASLEKKYSDILSQGVGSSDNLLCDVMEDLLYSAVMLNQAKVDSLEVTDDEVEGEMDRRLSYIIQQFGSVNAFESYYGKTIPKVKDEMRVSMRDQILIQKMQGKVSSKVRLTPQEVRDYYESIPKDSLPLIDAEVQVAHIVKYARVSKEAIDIATEKLKEYKNRINKGEKFSTLAVLYSEDQGSAIRGGEIGLVGRAEVEPEFSAAAFQLKEGEVSPIVETRHGFHIIQLIERRGAKINVRHILIKPRITEADMQLAKAEVDSIVKLIDAGKIDFFEAAREHSDDKDTKMNGGIIVNYSDGSSMTPMDKIEPNLFFVIDNLKVGEVSNAVEIQEAGKKPGYRVIKLLKRTEPHHANLKDDYQKIRRAAESDKEGEVLEEWIGRRIKETYIKIDPEYNKNCDFIQDWISNQQN